MGYGKSKGSQFERDTMRQIVKAFSKSGITDHDAFRSILSGGHKESYGDISLSPVLAKLFPFAAECKFYRKVDMYKLLEPWEKMGKSNLFRKWWLQTLEGAVKSKKLNPLLIFKANNKEVMCMLYSHHFCSIVGVDKSILRHKKIGHIEVYHPDGDLLCFDFRYLLKLLVKKGNRQ